MKLLKTLALLISISTLPILTSCSEDKFDNFPEDVYPTMNTKAAEPNDTTGAVLISINLDSQEYEEINYSTTIP